MKFQCNKHIIRRIIHIFGSMKYGFDLLKRIIDSMRFMFILIEI